MNRITEGVEKDEKKDMKANQTIPTESLFGAFNPIEQGTKAPDVPMGGHEDFKLIVGSKMAVDPGCLTNAANRILEKMVVLSALVIISALE